MSMKNNPYRAPKRWIEASSGDPASERPANATARFNRAAGRGYERIASSSGEINAWNKRDLMRQIGQVLDDARAGGIVKTSATQHQTPAQRQADSEAKLAMVKEAFNSKDTESLQILGETVGDEIWETLGREGFARRLYTVNPIPKGGTGRLRVRQKDVVAYVSTTSINVDEVVVRQKYVYPGEFYLLCNITIETKDIEQASGDILDDKFMDGLEQVLVQEDKVWKRQADAACTVFNSLTYFNTLTPAVYASLRSQVGRWGLPVTTCLLAYDLWTDVIAGDEFSSWYDPVSKHAIVLEGRLGQLLDTEIITDAIRHDTLQVLQPGELYFTSAPQTLGGITQRMELTTHAVDKFNQGKPERGWFMQQIEGMALVNSRGVSKGLRA